MHTEPNRDWRCEAHEELIRELSAVKAVGEQTLATVTRIEDRQYQTTEQQSRHVGAAAALAKGLGLGLTGLALLVAAASFAWTVIH